MGNRGNIIIKTRDREYTVPEGKPVIIRWKCKNKTRQGIAAGIGWIKQGKPHTVELIHQTFATWDNVEQEYPFRWTIWTSQILDIRLLTGLQTGLQKRK